VRDLTSPPLDDRQWQALVARAAAGDEPARRTLLERLWPVWTEMVRSSRSMGSFARSDDHVDAVVGRLIEKIARPDGRALRSYLDWQASHGDQTFADWIRIVTKNAVRDHLRDQLGTGEPTQAGEPSVKRLLNEFAVSPAIQAEEPGHRPPVTAAQTARELLEFAASRLPAGHLGALRQWLAGASFEEIGHAEGEPSAVARRKVRAGIAVLRRHFGADRGDAPPEEDL
jgi:DNA-directed RNA polymerase specialized sigma24 family protein